MKFLYPLVLVSAFLFGCAGSYQWSAKHPAYKIPPYSEIAVSGFDNFVLTRTKWFALRLNYGDSTQIKATSFCAKILAENFKGGYSKVTFIADSSLKKFPTESIKLDDRIFIKGTFPEQGIVVKDEHGNTPANILILNEVIIGTDLKRETFFDYALIHNEQEENRNVQNISAIVSYTLWDNLKQRPLFSAVDEVNHFVGNPKNKATDLSSKITEDDLKILMVKVATQIRKNLYQGAK